MPERFERIVSKTLHVFPGGGFEIAGAMIDLYYWRAERTGEVVEDG